MRTDSLPALGGSQSFVHGRVAVVVFAVAGLRSAGEYTRIKRRTILGVQHPIVIIIEVTKIALVVVVKIALIGIEIPGAVVCRVHYPVVVVVRVHAIGFAVVVQIRESFVLGPVTVVIHSVADFFRPGMYVEIQGLAVTYDLGAVQLLRQAQAF